MGKLTKLEDSNTFEKDVIASSKITLVDFYADWCGPCKVMHPILEELAQDAELENSAVIKANVEDVPDLAQKYAIRSIPTILFFKEGKVMKTLVGVQSKEDLKKIFQELK